MSNTLHMSLILDDVITANVTVRQLYLILSVAFCWETLTKSSETIRGRVNDHNVIGSSLRQVSFCFHQPQVLWRYEAQGSTNKPLLKHCMFSRLLLHMYLILGPTLTGKNSPHFWIPPSCKGRSFDLFIVLASFFLHQTSSRPLFSLVRFVPHCECTR